MQALSRGDVDIAFDIAFDVGGSGDVAFDAGHERTPAGAVLLTHGFCATSRMFAANIPALAAEHLAISWDLRGHGQSGAPDDPSRYTVPIVLDDMVALLDHLGVARATLIGHSIGGYLSLEFALAHPERVEALVLVDTGPGFRRDDARGTWNAMAERYARSLIDRGLDGIPAGTELHANAHRSATGLIHFARGVLTQRDASVLDGLTSIAVPTLVVVGADDSGFLAGSHHMAAKIPNARLVVIPDAGHAPNIDDPDSFDREVCDFLAGGRGEEARVL